jgi:hypothetical protein
MTKRSRRPIIVLTIAACAVWLTACTTMVTGKAVRDAHAMLGGDQESSPMPSSPAPSGSAGSRDRFDLCSLLDYKDLPYDGKADSGFGPTKDVSGNYEQSCGWTANLGSSKGVTQLLFSMRPTVRVKRPTGTFVVGGQRVKIGELAQGSGRQRKVTGCVSVLNFAGGRLGIAVDDVNGAFGTPCDQVKHVASLVAAHKPR